MGLRTCPGRKAGTATTSSFLTLEHLLDVLRDLPEAGGLQMFQRFLDVRGALLGIARLRGAIARSAGVFPAIVAGSRAVMAGRTRGRGGSAGSLGLHSNGQRGHDRNEEFCIHA